MKERRPCEFAFINIPEKDLDLESQCKVRDMAKMNAWRWGRIPGGASIPGQQREQHTIDLIEDDDDEGYGNDHNQNHTSPASSVPVKLFSPVKPTRRETSLLAAVACREAWYKPVWMWLLRVTIGHRPMLPTEPTFQLRI
jgi:hypothetical protein